MQGKHERAASADNAGPRKPVHRRLVSLSAARRSRQHEFDLKPFFQNVSCLDESGEGY